MGQGRTRVVVADGHPVYRQGLIDAIARRASLEVVAEAETGTSALEAIRKLHPDVVVLAARMPKLDGIEVAQAILHEELTTRVLFVSAFLEGITIYRAVEAGARGYISKDSSAELICDAITAVAEGRTVLPPESQNAVMQEIRKRSQAALNPLTERERQILVLTSDGRTVGQVADELCLASATVRTHLRRIYLKLGVPDRAGAVAEAMRRGWL